MRPHRPSHHATRTPPGEKRWDRVVNAALRLRASATRPNRPSCPYATRCARVACHYRQMLCPTLPAQSLIAGRQVGRERRHAYAHAASLFFFFHAAMPCMVELNICPVHNVLC